MRYFPTDDSYDTICQLLTKNYSVDEFRRLQGYQNPIKMRLSGNLIIFTAELVVKFELKNQTAQTIRDFFDYLHAE